MANIPFVSNFPAGPTVPGVGNCQCTWSDIIWATATVGKANLREVFRYGMYSWCEVLYRSFMMYGNLVETSQHLLARSTPFKRLDPSEKGAVSYFLGITVAKLFAARYLGVPWLMHLDVHRRHLRPTFTGGKSKPDLVGYSPRHCWITLEAKGRTGGLPRDLLAKAKLQTEKLRSIRGKSVGLRVALVSHFGRRPSDPLRVAWEDPEGRRVRSRDLDITLETFIRAYYQPLIDMAKSEIRPTRTLVVRDRRFQVMAFAEIDMEVGIDERLFELTVSKKGDIEQLLEFAGRSHGIVDREHTMTIGPDGVIVVLGRNWNEEAMMRQPDRRQA